MTEEKFYEYWRKVQEDLLAEEKREIEEEGKWGFKFAPRDPENLDPYGPQNHEVYHD